MILPLRHRHPARDPIPELPSYSMPRARRKIAFLLAAPDRGAMIANRFDDLRAGNDT